MRFLLLPLVLPLRLLAWVFARLRLVLWGYPSPVLELSIRGRLPDRGARPSWLRFFSREREGIGLLDVVRVLDRAARDPRIDAVLVRIGPLHSGLARAEEVHEALAKVRASEKRVVAYLEEAGLAEYLVALGAGRIVLPPSGSLNVVGVSSEVVLLKGLLDRVGVRAWLRAQGKYKSARETFAEDEMTAANREMTESLVHDLHDQLVQKIAESRSITATSAREALDTGPLLPGAAVKWGLVDAIAYEDEVREELDVLPPRRPPLSVDAYLKRSAHLAPRGRVTQVALLEVTGHIKSGASVPGRDGTRATGSRDFAREVQAIAKDPRVEAVVLRVDSPGGSALASDVMWRELTRVKKPVVVSMANVAASGGYFVSGLPGATILASGATITGSIGVLAGKMDLGALYQRLGVQKVIVGAGKRAGYFSEARGFTDGEVPDLEADLEHHYGHFLARMAEGRGKSREAIHELAQGRVWTGRQALENGLCDEHGGLAAALSRVRAVLGLPERAALALVSGPTERRRFPLRLEWTVPEAVLPDGLLSPLRLAEHFRNERWLALLPFDLRLR